PVEQQGLRLSGSDYATDAQFASWIFCERQHHVGALDATEFIEDGARAVTQPGTTLRFLRGSSDRRRLALELESTPGHGPGPDPRADARWAAAKVRSCGCSKL